MASIGFIGTGTMGAVVARVVAEGAGDCELLFSNRTVEKAEKVAQELFGAVSDNRTIARECSIIFLGVKPQMLASVLQEIAPSLSRREGPVTLVSMVAGVTTATIQALVGGTYEVIRMMPNSPLSVGVGVVQYCGTDRDSIHLKQVGRWLAGAGMADLVTESMMDACTAISGCGPAFVAMFAEAMADAGVLCGLSREKSMRYVAQTLVGTGEMMLQLEKHPSVLKDEVCSPGGATICGVAMLERHGFRNATIHGVLGAYERMKELAES